MVTTPWRDPASFGRAWCLYELAKGIVSCVPGLDISDLIDEKEAFPFAAIAMALNAAVSTVLVSVPSVRRLLLRVAGA